MPSRNRIKWKLLKGLFKSKGRLTRVEYEKYLASEHWKTLRIKKLIESHYRCQACGTNQQLQVHHCTYQRLFHERFSDLIVLCRVCHKLVHGIIKSDPRVRHRQFWEVRPRLNFRVYG